MQHWVFWVMKVQQTYFKGCAMLKNVCQILTEFFCESIQLVVVAFLVVLLCNKFVLFCFIYFCICNSRTRYFYMSTLSSVLRRLIVYKPCGFLMSFLAMCSLNFNYHCKYYFYLYMANKLNLNLSLKNSRLKSLEC